MREPQMKPLTAAAMLAALFLSGCFEDNSIGANQVCKSDCFNLNGVAGDSPAALDAEIQKMCDDMGKHGKPKITEQTKSSVSGQCMD